MSMVINTNSLSLLTQNNLNKSQASLNTAIQRLSSGLRINSAKDDAAGQAIANRFTANINGLSQAQRNANDGISLAQTTEGALTEVNNNLQRIRDLSVQAANGSNSAADKASIQAEITQRLAEIDRSSAQTDFNGLKVLASDQALSIQVGANDSQTISINLKKVDTASLGLTGFNVDGSGTPNTAATQSNLQLKAAYTTGTAGTAGYTTNSAWVQGATVAGTTAYTQTVVTKTASDTAGSTTARAAATAADVFGVVDNTSTVKLNGSAATIDNYAVAGAGATLRFNSTTGAAAATTNASVATSLIPTGGAQTQAVVTIGGSAQAISIDSTGNVTDQAGNQLYLDTTGSLTLNNSGTLTAAHIGGGGAGDLLASMNDTGVNANAAAQLGTIAVTTAGGSTITYTGGVGAGAGGDAWDFSNSLTQADMQAKSAAAASTSVDVDGGGATVAFDISGAGAVTQGAAAIFIDPAGVGAAQLSTTANTVVAATVGATATTTETYYVHSNGAVMDNAGNQVYADSDPTDLKGFTLNAASGSTITANALSVIDAALAKVDGVRGALGAVQNRFDSVISNLGTTVTNLTASRSRIEDADYATEVSNMTRAQILQQAGTSVLAQANQTSQGVLSLLR